MSSSPNAHLPGSPSTYPLATSARHRPWGRGGFSLVELTIVLVLSALALTVAGVTFSGYLQRTSAQRAAQVFARDLKVARSSALRAREPVVIRFYESSLWYTVVLQESGTEILRRHFGVDGDISLSAVTFSQAGDTLVFDSRGIADVDAAGESHGLGEATFWAGATSFQVSFNAMGASRIEEN